MLRLLFILAALMMLAMVFRPMRRHILRRLDITATILLIVLPLMATGRLLYTVQQGGWEERDGIAFVVLTVSALIGLWIGLWWLTNTLERRRPTRGGGLPLFPGRLAQRWLGLPAVPAVPAAEVERKGLGLARFTGRLWGRTRTRRGPRQSQRKPANSPAAQSAAKPAATPVANPTTAAVYNALRAIGMVEHVARDLIRDHGINEVEYQLRHLKRVQARRQIDNPAGWIHDAVRGKWRYKPPATRRRAARRRAASSSKMDNAAMTLGRIGGSLFGRAEKATRPKSSSSRRRRK